MTPMCNSPGPHVSGHPRTTSHLRGGDELSIGVARGLADRFPAWEVTVGNPDVHAHAGPPTDRTLALNRST